MKPVTAGSIVISLMRVAPDDEVLHELGKLLLSPLLMNYPGSVRQYLTKQAGRESGKVKETIDKALASLEKYVEDLRTVPRLPALHPTQAQRDSYRRHIADTMARSMSCRKTICLLRPVRTEYLALRSEIHQLHISR